VSLDSEAGVRFSLYNGFFIEAEAGYTQDMARLAGINVRIDPKEVKLNDLLPSRLSLYLFDSADNTALQPHLDAVGMCTGFCQNAGNNAVCKNAGALILLLHNLDLHSHLNVSSICSVHHQSSLLKLAARAASFLSLGCFLIFISRRSAAALGMHLLAAKSSTGNLALVYLDAVPLLCVINRFSILFVMPVYSVLSRQRRI
jgi:hypothetical protein